jgi:GAF domain-containing protein
MLLAQLFERLHCFYFSQLRHVLRLRFDEQHLLQHVHWRVHARVLGVLQLLRHVQPRVEPEYLYYRGFVRIKQLIVERVELILSHEHRVEWQLPYLF